MSVTFTKLFASITESTVWCEPDTTRLCWITMLAMADSRGRVFGSIPGLANRARVSVDAARTAINTFLSPDPDSRSSNNEGRRIEALEGGWRLINHEKYRAIRDHESIKETKRKWAAKNREKAKEVDQKVDNSVYSRSQETVVDRDRHNAEAEAEADKEESKSTPLSPSALGFEKFWSAYPKKEAKKDALKAWLAAGINGDLDKVLSALEAQKTLKPDWASEKGKYIPLPATWIRGRRWEDEVGKQVASTGRPFSC